MPHPRTPLRARLLSAVAALAAVLCHAPAARAQLDCLPPGSEEHQSQPVCNFPPRLDVTPDETSVTQPAVMVSITASDHFANGNLSSFQVLLDGVDVTASWKRTTTTSGWGTGVMQTITAGGRVALTEAAPQKTLTVKLCDDEGCNERVLPFTLSMPRVAVTPDGFSGTVGTGATRSTAFKVFNRGSQAGTFLLSVGCRDDQGQAVSGCSLTVTSATIAAGDSVTLAAIFPATQTGRMLTITTTARLQGHPGVQDLGWTDIIPRLGSGTAESAPQVALVPLNAGGTIDRAQCVTVATAPRGAYECGDLRIVHPLPPHRTRNRTWTPALLYNGQHAHPTPTVYADVTVPAGAAVPTSVEMVVALRGGATHRASFTGSGFVPGLPRRIAVQWDGLQTSTGLYKYDVQVISHYAGGPRASAADSGEVAVVNRSGTPFGAGWWVAGWEQLVCIDCASGGSRLLWIGGDGSTRVFEPAVPGAWSEWTAQSPDGPPETLSLAMEGGIWAYTRKLRGGGFVQINSTGQHFRTVNRLGQITLFDIQSNRLAGISVPSTSSGVAPAWLFTYDATGRLTTVNAATQSAPSRVVTLRYPAGDYRVTAIDDPDGRTVSFAYPTGTWTRRISRQRDKRGTYTYYGFDGTGRLSSARTQMGATADASVDITRSFIAVERRGVALSGSITQTPVTISEAYTRLDGPRTDVTDYTWMWHTRTGTVRRVRDPLGAETFVEFDGRFPQLATAVTGPGGLRTTAVYDTRGRVVSSTVLDPYGDGQSATTTYAWDDRWDAPIRISAPGVGSIHMAYDPVTGNRLWRQQGESTALRVDYTYWPAGHAHAGQLASVVAPANGLGQRAVDSVYYDAVGNLKSTRSPLGFRTLHVRDRLGRDSLVYTPIADNAAARDTAALKTAGARQTTLYDVRDRPVTQVTYAPQVNHAVNANGFAPPASVAEELTVETVYDPEGLPLTVVRSIFPNPGALENQVTEYTYDGAGRKTSETTADQLTTTFEHDRAGNVTAVLTPRLARITSEYDAGGRLLRRKVPAAAQGRQGGTCPQNGPAYVYDPTCSAAVFPYYPNNGTGYLVPEDWTWNRYDESGNLVYAENGDAAVQRSYYPNGQLRTDTLRIRDLDTGEYGTRAYGMRYTYFLNGQLGALQHPGDLAGSSNVDQWAYHGVTGALEHMQDRNGNYFNFRYDNTGRPTGITEPGGIVDSLRYDLEGRLAGRREAVPGGTPLQDETLTYDARGKLLRVDVGVTQGPRGSSTFWQWYSGLGNLVGTDWANNNDVQWMREAFVVDPLGNMIRKRTHQPGAENAGNDWPDYQYTMDPWFGRVTNIDLVDNAVDTTHIDETTRTYDLAGNVSSGFQIVTGDGSDGGTVATRIVQSRSYYGHDDRLRAFQEYDDRPSGSSSRTSAGVWEEYRYDPLGRRVAVRTLRASPLCTVDSWTCISATSYFVWSGDQLLWELKTATGSQAAQAGGKVSYAHAGGIDRPLVIWKQGVGSIVTHQNWRGQFARGTWGAGSTKLGQSSDCSIYPPSGCVPVPWPGWNTTAWHEDAADEDVTGYKHYWLGSLATGMRDASGQMYMRNRYYDPQTGQFTQVDPIGLAGGLNAYGFAAGDPVSYSDPYGLCPYEGKDRTADLADCPDDDRKAAFGHLEQDNTGEGQAVIQSFVKNKYTFELTPQDINCAGTLTTSCSSGGHIRVNGTQDAQIIATDVVHEVLHQDTPPNTMSAGREEISAWDHALNFYDGLAPGLRNNAMYNSASTTRVTNRAGFENFFCQQLGC